jgi:hypothetical protein
MRVKRKNEVTNILIEPLRIVLGLVLRHAGPIQQNKY